MTTARTVPEWVGKHPDEAVPRRVKDRIFLRDGGRCQACTRRVGPGGEPYALDHKIALVNGGEHREGNLQLLCQNPCHAAKTATDVAIKSKTYDMRKKHIGADKPARPSRLSKEYRRAALARIQAEQAKREELT